MSGNGWKFLIVAGMSGVVAWLSYRRKCGRRPITPEQPLVSQERRSVADIEEFMRTVQKKDFHKLETVFEISKSSEISDTLLKQVLRRLCDLLTSANSRPPFAAAIVEHSLVLMATRPDVAVDAADVLVESTRDKLRNGVEISDVAVTEILRLLADKKLPTSLVQRVLRALYYLVSNKANADRFPLGAVLDVIAIHRHSPGVMIDGLNALSSIVSNATTVPHMSVAVARTAETSLSIGKSADNPETIWRCFAVLMALQGRVPELFHSGNSMYADLCFEALEKHGRKHRQLAERGFNFLVVLGGKVGAEKKPILDSVVAAHGKTLPVLSFYAAQIYNR
jgi:hypothetical protein